jgi:hypothetical protein
MSPGRLAVEEPAEQSSQCGENNRSLLAQECKDKGSQGAGFIRPGFSLSCHHKKLQGQQGEEDRQQSLKFTRVADDFNMGITGYPEDWCKKSPRARKQVQAKQVEQEPVGKIEGDIDKMVNPDVVGKEPAPQVVVEVGCEWPVESRPDRAFGETILDRVYGCRIVPYEDHVLPLYGFVVVPGPWSMYKDEEAYDEKDGNQRMEIIEDLSNRGGTPCIGLLLRCYVGYLSRNLPE